jgi:hypothetical protein
MKIICAIGQAITLWLATAQSSDQSQLAVKVALRDVYPVLSSHHVIYDPTDSREACLSICLLYTV